MNDTTTDGADDALEPGPEPETLTGTPSAARGPHLPGVLGRLPWLAWVFILLAIGDIATYVIDLNVPAGFSIADVAIYVLQVIPSVAVILLPAALLARHPDATNRARTLLFGTILYAAVQGMLLLSGPLQGFFEGLTPPSEELPFLVPMAAVYNGLISVVAAFGLTYMAVGLSQARRYEDRRRSVTILFVPIAAVFGTVVGVLAVAGLDLGDLPMSPTLGVYLGTSVILGVIRIVAWAYLATAATRGWLAHEDPAKGWGLGSVGAGLVVFALALVNLNGLLAIQDATLVTVYRYLIIIAYALGHVGLLAAFALGLPALDWPDDEFDDDEFDDDESDDESDDEEFDDVHEDPFEDESASDEPAIADPTSAEPAIGEPAR